MKKKNEPNPEESVESRIRYPHKSEGEMFAYVASALGGARMLCYCEDGKERICRIPGRLKKYIWVREGDYVIVKPWEIEGDKRGDIIWRYRPIEVSYLKNRGKLNFI